MTKTTSLLVVMAASFALVLTACGGGPGTGGMDTNGDGMPSPGDGDGMTLPHVGEWHFAPHAVVTLEADTFTIAVGDGMEPLGTEPPFNAITKIVAQGALAVMDSTYTLSVDPDSVEIEYVDPTHAAVIAPIIGAAIATAASAPAMVDINLMRDPPTMTIVAPFITPLLGLPPDARLRACKDMPCSAPNAEAWWNSLNAEQMVAALYGDLATLEEAAAAKMMYADLDPLTRMRVDLFAVMINGHLSYDSVGAWWESLNCREMRIAAGDGNTTNPMSPYCRHYPGSDFPPEKILSDDALAHVNKVGMALLGRTDPGTYPAPG